MSIKNTLAAKQQAYLYGAGYGIRTRGLNFGKVACYHYTKPANTL